MKQNEYYSYLSGRGRVKRLLRRLMLMPIVRFFSGEVLDIGCGIGEFLAAYPNAVGVDFNRKCVASCNERGFTCVEGNVYCLPFEDNKFDGVLLNNVLEHLDRPEDAFREIKRVLRNGGRLCMELPGMKGFRHDPTHVKFWGKEETVSFLEKYGFIDITVKYFPVPIEYAGNILTHNKLRVFAIRSK